MGCEEPAISMDNSGKIIWAKHNNIKTANTKVNLGNYNKDIYYSNNILFYLFNCVFIYIIYKY